MQTFERVADICHYSVRLYIVQDTKNEVTFISDFFEQTTAKKLIHKRLSLP